MFSELKKIKKELSKEIKDLDKFDAIKRLIDLSDKYIGMEYKTEYIGREKEKIAEGEILFHYKVNKAFVEIKSNNEYINGKYEVSSNASTISFSIDKNGETIILSFDRGNIYQTKFKDAVSKAKINKTDYIKIINEIIFDLGKLKRDEFISCEHIKLYKDGVIRIENIISSSSC